MLGLDFMHRSSTVGCHGRRRLSHVGRKGLLSLALSQSPQRIVRHTLLDDMPQGRLRRVNLTPLTYSAAVRHGSIKVVLGICALVETRIFFAKRTV